MHFFLIERDFVLKGETNALNDGDLSSSSSSSTTNAVAKKSSASKKVSEGSKERPSKSSALADRDKSQQTLDHNRNRTTRKPKRLTLGADVEEVCAVHF